MTLCLVVPLLVLYARLYRGMHRLANVLVGLLNGLACAALAWGWLRAERSVGREAHDGAATSPGTAASSA